MDPTNKKNSKRIHPSKLYIATQGLLEPKPKAIETSIILLIMNIKK